MPGRRCPDGHGSTFNLYCMICGEPTVAGIKRSIHIDNGVWFCSSCGKWYTHRPRYCGACGKASFFEGKKPER